MSQGTIGLYSVARKLRKDKKTTEEFEVMLGNLSLEEVVALKLELSGKIIKRKLYGFNLYHAIPEITKEAVFKYAVSANRSKKAAADFMGITYRYFKMLARKYNIDNYFKENE